MKQNIYIILVLLFCNIIALGQAPNWSWAKSSTGCNQSESYGVVTDAAGNIYTTGYFAYPSITFGNITLTSGGSSNIFIAKYDSLGNVLWAKTAVETSSNASNGIAIDTYANVYITGVFGSDSITFGNITLINSSLPWGEVFVVKYDSSGNVLWAKSAHGDNLDYPFSICTDAANNVLITGYFSSLNLVFGSFNLSGSGSIFTSDVFTAKYDAFGNVLWAKQSIGNDIAYSRSVSTDYLNNVIITGTFTSPTINFSGNSLTNIGSNYNMFTTKYDEYGNVLWAKNAGGISRGHSCSTDALGNIYSTGEYYGSSITFNSIILNNSAPAYSDIFLIKIDQFGNFIWGRSAGGNNQDDCYKITIDNSANFYLAGSFVSSNITFGSINLNNVSPSDTNDIFITKYDSSGTALWAKGVGGTKRDYGYSVTPDDFGSIYVTGTFESNSIMFGNDTFTNTGIAFVRNMFIAKLSNSSVGISELKNNDSFTIFSNPFVENISIVIHKQNLYQATFIIKNILGQTVFSKKENNFIYPYITTIDLSFLSKGIYLLEVNTNGESAAKKIVKE